MGWAEPGWRGFRPTLADDIRQAAPLTTEPAALEAARLKIVRLAEDCLPRER